MSNMEKLKSGAEQLGLHLTPRQLELFDIYYQELTDWNRRLNLTRITDYAAVQVKHFLDSLTVVLGADFEKNGPRVIDVGTGAGLPGIPVKILFPDINLVLLEATAKKADFLHHLAGRLGLEGVEIVVGRAEEAAHDARYRETFGVVLSRAVASLPALVELTLPFVTVGGRLIAQKKGEVGTEVAQSSKAINVLGGRLREIKTVLIDELKDRRCLVIIDKVKVTPPESPRRPGIPVKRPLR